MAGEAMTSGTDASASPIRIAFVLHALEPGGIERFVTTLCNLLPPERFQPSIVCLAHRGSAAGWLERCDVPVHELRKRNGNDPRLPWRLARLLRRSRTQIVQSHNWGTLLETTIARRLAKIPVHIHAERGTVLGGLDPRGLRMKARGLVTRRALQSTTAVISNAYSVAQRVEAACGFDRSKIVVIPNGVPTPRETDRSLARVRIRKQLGIPEDSAVIGSVGRLVPVKGFDIAIEALRRLRRSHSNVHLLILGDGPERERLQQCARDCSVAAQVHLVGHQDRIHDWLAAMDIYVNASRSEGMSQAVLEAMAAGLPLVVTDVGDNERLVGDPPCGQVVPTETPEALADAIRRLVQSPEQRHTASKNAIQKHVAGFSLPAMVERYTTLYARLIDESTPFSVLDGISCR